MSVQIVKGSLQDLKGVISLNKRTLPEHYSEAFWRTCIDMFPDGFWIARDETKHLCGYIVCSYRLFSPDTITAPLKIGQIVSVAVDKNYRGRKIGEQLCLKAIESMKEHQMGVVILQVRESNKVAITLYHKLGFVLNKRLIKYYHNPEENGWEMIKFFS